MVIRRVHHCRNRVGHCGWKSLLGTYDTSISWLRWKSASMCWSSRVWRAVKVAHVRHRVQRLYLTVHTASNWLVKSCCSAICIQCRSLVICCQLLLLLLFILALVEVIHKSLSCIFRCSNMIFTKLQHF